LRILVVNWQDRLNPQAGGAEVHLHEVFGRLAEMGHQVTLLVSGFPGAPHLENLDGMEVHRVGGRYTFSLRAPLYLRRQWSPGAFDVIVEDLNKVPLFLPLLTRTPVVLLVHHLFGTTAFKEATLAVASATWMLELLIPRAYGNCPVVAVSGSTMTDLKRRGMAAGPTAIVPNGLDLDRLWSDAAVTRFPDPTILYLGRLKRYKGIDLVLRALARLRGRGDCPHLLIAGKGNDEVRLRRLTRTLGLEDRVTFKGFVDEEEKVRLLRQSWVHVLTSPKEGWGISVMEAAACGTPTVASDSPGLRDAVKDGETGLLVPHGDVDALAEKLSHILARREEREAMGRRAREYSRWFSWDRSAQDMLLFLEARVAGGHSKT
jgi:glycosyltransferase involved in cell wall biosynthesis